MDQALALPALVLLDEAGAGTDPIEGGALAMAIIDHFRRRGAMVVATTHYDALKTYASTTEGVMAAGFGFDPETFAPTYRLNYGSPGSSLALEIADAARACRPTSSSRRARIGARARSQLAEHLAKVERDMQALEHERRLAARERETLAETRAPGCTRASRSCGTGRRRSSARLDERIDERLRDARREIDAVVDALKARTDALAAEAERRMAPRLIPTGETGAARAEARAAIDAIGERLREHAGRSRRRRRRRSEPGRAPASAIACSSARFGLEGVVQALHDRRRGSGRARQTAARAGRRAARGRRRPRRCERSRRGCGSTSTCSRARASLDRDERHRLRTSTRRSAAIEKFLDEALLSELKTVRIIHGYGTGQLRRAIARVPAARTRSFATSRPRRRTTRAAAGSRWWS